MASDVDAIGDLYEAPLLDIDSLDVTPLGASLRLRLREAAAQATLVG